MDDKNRRGPFDEWIPSNEMGNRDYQIMLADFWDIVELLIHADQNEKGWVLPDFTETASAQLRGLKHPGAPGAPDAPAK